ncbi:PssE/Cps14G family polysaccharide biosynthesis glycosyltransferase [Methanobacterium formicicum]|uniref:Beta-1,4-galactosyltransferase n=1 Tax=Methanobacterium formicicum (strain DSM 3637 / PP1) TaxID=1204725 RepID=K2QE56_METFP|nr:PssE/Cps14G family polysaccharide biosynthesis glycosyltransferase [Methanobacterium formicicum]EKF86356.1 beta-1,4-galactosyltransferase [Methanobacterium formicicum DSM 3637]
MIFVTVGTHYQGFDRLIKKMDEIAGYLNDDVVMQIGNTDFEPENTEWFRYLDYNSIFGIMKKSDIVICHGGAGTLLDVLSMNKKTIVVPRLKKFKEVYDDHELELAESLKNGKISIVYDIADLEHHIREFNDSCNGIPRKNENSKLIDFLSGYLKGD